MRYFAEIAYNGAQYVGWQVQPNGITVQQTIDEALSLILGVKIEVLGCGRTDAGVHASQFFLHFDFEGTFPKGFVHRLNKVLPKDIAVYSIFPVKEDMHARFSATKRSYEYHIDLRKNPFRSKIIFQYPYNKELDFEKMNQAVQLLLNYDEFFPFCKTHSDAKTMFCDITRAEWVKINDTQWVFHISSNRFLRGMVRLIVGMSINIGRGKLEIEDVKEALEQQKTLKQSYSVPPDGLFLTEVSYPDLI